MHQVVPGNLVSLDEYAIEIMGVMPPPCHCARCGFEVGQTWDAVHVCQDCWENEVEKQRSFGWADAVKRARKALGLL